MATANKKPGPLYPQTPRAACPVCGQPSYSHEGIHPQCAMHVTDQLHIERLKSGGPVSGNTASGNTASVNTASGNTVIGQLP